MENVRRTIVGGRTRRRYRYERKRRKNRTRTAFKRRELREHARNGVENVWKS